MAATIHRRLVTLLKRRGLLSSEDDAAEEQLDALRACGRLAAHPGRRERMGPALALVDDDEVEQPKDGIRAVTGGVNVYASGPMEDRQTIERVARYLLRAPLSLCRLKMRPDGMLTYRLKKPDRRGNTVLVLSPMELMGRLASLIPVPGHPTRRAFGVPAPGAKDRAKVVPAPTRAKRRCGQQEEARRAPVAHRIPWAELLRRVFGVDALSFGKCGAMMTALASIKAPDEVARMVAHLEAPWDKNSTGPPGLAA